jgi:transcriptional regulator with XRE-family HTH domain
MMVMDKKNTSPTPVKVVFDPEPVRQKTGLTKQKFAALIKVSQNGYTGLSNNPSQVRLETLGKILTATGCSISDLYRVEPLA